MIRKINFLLLFLMAGFTVFSQTTFISTTQEANWTANTMSGVNSNPLPWNTMMGLSFGPVIPYDSDFCRNPFTQPAQQVAPAGVNCVQEGAHTAFYKTSFVLGPNAVCQTKASIRVLGLFRVFINGVQFTPSLTYNNCSNTNVNSLNGVGSNVYDFDNFNQLLIPGGQNTIIVEVTDCSGIYFLQALFTIRQASSLPDPFIPAVINYTFTGNVFNSINVNLWGTNFKHLKAIGIPGPYSANWTLELGPNSSGPWSPFGTRNEPPSPNSTENNPWVVTIPNNRCLRITYTVNTGCNFNTIVYIVCFGAKPAGAVTYSGSGSSVDPSKPENWKDTDHLNSPLEADPYAVAATSDHQYPDHRVYTDQGNSALYIDVDKFDRDEFALTIFSLNGQLMFSAPLLQSELTILDLTNWTNGIYFVKFQSKSGAYSDTKKFVLVRP